MLFTPLHWIYITILAWLCDHLDPVVLILSEVWEKKIHLVTSYILEIQNCLVLLKSFLVSGVMIEKLNIRFKTWIELSFCHKPWFSNLCKFSISFQPYGVSLWYFKLTLFHLREFIVWNILGLRHRVAKI